MTKKQIRNRNQKRRKEWAQNARRQERERRAREFLTNFQIEFVSPVLRNLIAENWTDQPCLLCDQKVLETELRSRQFSALKSKQGETNIYFVHQAHIFERDGDTMKPEAEANMQRIFTLMAEIELAARIKT